MTRSAMVCGVDQEVWEKFEPEEADDAGYEEEDANNVEFGDVFSDGL